MERKIDYSRIAETAIKVAERVILAWIRSRRNG